MRATLFVFCLLAATAAAQVSTSKDALIKGKAVAAAPAAAAVSVPQIAKAADGKWRCVDGAGKPCTEAQLQTLRTATRSRSNIQNNFVLNGDGTVSCTNAGKACSDAEMQNTAAELSKAIAKGGPAGN